MNNTFFLITQNNDTKFTYTVYINDLMETMNLKMEILP